jgi:hypothetical protein
LVNSPDQELMSCSFHLRTNWLANFAAVPGLTKHHLM